VASAAGALLIGAAWTLAADRRTSTLGLSLLAGLAGSLADSVAGATLQASYQCVVCSQPAETPAEHCGQPTRLVRGHAWITNDVVNVIGTTAGALVGATASLART
jgi:uncharacterized membrane protein